MRLQIRRKHLLVGAAIVGAGALYGATLPVQPAWIGQLRLFAYPAPPPHEASPQEPAWVASAPGKVEPASGEVRVGSLVLGRVAAVLVKVNDRVHEGDLLIRLDAEEAKARLDSAEAQAALREEQRDAVRARGAAARLRKAEDEVAAAERALAEAWRRRDRMAEERAAATDLSDARRSVAETRRRLESAREELARRKAAATGTPAAHDTALAIARADLDAAEALFQKTRIRAPIDGTVLQLPVRAGETVAPSRQRPLAVVGDLSRLRVRVDLDERNRWHVFVGQPAIIRSESSADPFEGRVAAIAPALVPAQESLGGRRPAHAASVVEVLVDIVGPARLMPGMQVDVFFLKSDAG